MMNGGMCPVHKLSWVLVVVGAINWGLIGVFNFNLVNAILGGVPVAERIVYILVGIAGIAAIAMCKCSACKK